MNKYINHIPPAAFVILATLFEVAGDAIIRKCIHDFTGPTRVLMFLAGAVLVFGYGFFLNLPPVDFGKVVGLYITSLFVVWQVGNYIAFGQLPTLPVIVGGTLIIIGGLLIFFWEQ